MWNKPSGNRLLCIPRLFETELTPIQNKLVHLHFFIGGCDWYICEYDGDDLFFGYAILNGDFINAEWGYVSFSELIAISINGIEVDCELEDYWPPTPVSEISKIVDRSEGGLKPRCKLIGEDGDVFNLISVVRNTLKRCNLYHELEWFDCDLELIQESGGTHDDVLALFMDYVEVV